MSRKIVFRPSHYLNLYGEGVLGIVIDPKNGVVVNSLFDYLTFSERGTFRKSIVRLCPSGFYFKRGDTRYYLKEFSPVPRQ